MYYYSPRIGFKFFTAEDWAILCVRVHVCVSAWLRLAWRQKGSPNETGVFCAWISQRLSRAELVSYPLRALWEKRYYLLNVCLSTSFLSGHQEFGEVKPNCPLSHPLRPSSSILRDGNQGTKWSGSGVVQGWSSLSWASWPCGWPQALQAFDSRWNL